MMNNATSNRRRQAIENSVRASEIRATVTEAYISARVAGYPEPSAREHSENVRTLCARSGAGR